MKVSLARVSALLAVALAAGSLSVPAAGAAPLGSCAKLAAAATFSPGLSNTPHDQKISATGTVTNCTPAASTGGSGTLTANIAVKAGSCQKLSQGAQKLSGTGSTVWKNKKTSKYSLNFTTGTGANITTVTISGKVTSGLFVGKKVSGTVKFTLQNKPDCSTSKPIKSVKVTQVKPFVIS